MKPIAPGADVRIVRARMRPSEASRMQMARSPPPVARRVPVGNAFILQYRKKTLAVTPQWRPLRGKLVTAGYARFALAQKLAAGRRRERLPE